MDRGASSNSWVIRSLVAGLVAAALGVGVGWGNYFALDGSMKLDWAIMGPVVIAYGGLCALLTGLGLGGGMVFATRRRADSVSATRLVLGAMVGALIGCSLPATLGIAGFAHLDAPYAGTANILGSTLLAATTYIALFAPALMPTKKLRLLPRLGLSAVAATLTAITLGTLAWTFVGELDLVPTFPELATTAERMGLWRFGAIVGTGLSAAIGLFMGLATWVYATLAVLLDR